VPSWGGDLSTRNRDYFMLAPWLLIAPGVALSLLVIAYNFFGDALRDILDPRLRGSR
jgi:peptide/nickel transport system permease protein